MPLGPSEAVPCPACGQSVALTDEYRALRDATARSVQAATEAQRVFAALGRPPAAVWRLFTFFDSAVFWAVGLPFWLCFGVGLSAVAQQAVARRLGANLEDVLEPHQVAALSLLLPSAVLVLGLLLSGWARKRTVARGGLQAALAARPPSRDGGPAGCRRCGAPLHVTADALGVRCPWCETDNLVRLPASWLQHMQRHTAKLGHETAAAAKALDDARSSLRWSFFWRAALGALVLSPGLLIIGASDALPSVQAYDPSGKPGTLPSWSKAVAAQLPCTGNMALFHPRTERDHCDATSCTLHALVAARGGQTVVVASDDVPEGTEAWVEAHEVTFLDSRWKTTAHGKLHAGHRLTWKAPLSGWYRVRATVPDPSPGRSWSLCAGAE